MKSLYTLILLAVTITGFSQTRITGKVMDEKGIPVPGANVFLLDTYDGTSTGVDGTFEFTTTETGKFFLIVKFVGYREFRQEIDLTGKSISLEATLKEEVSELNAVTITAGAFAASDESRRTIFRAVDIASTAGATADIAGALNTLPGTQKVGESGRLFVRGGDGHEAQTFIDGLLVMDAYSPSAPNTPSRGRFLPFMFKGTSFSTGGYSAEYGQALSSALVLDSRDQAEATRTDIGLLSVGADVTHTQAWKHGSIAGKLQYTDIRPYFGLINQEIDWKTPPVGLEGSTAFRHQVGDNGMLKFFGNFNHTNFSLYNHDIADYSSKQLYELTNDYYYLNGFYRQSLNDNWSVRGGMSYSFIRDDARISGDQRTETNNGIHAKAVLEGTVSNQLELRMGMELVHQNHAQVSEPEQATVTNEEVNSMVTAAFVETDVLASNSFVVRGGARFEYASLITKPSVDPRISIAYKTGEKGQVSFAYGKFRQQAKTGLLCENKNLSAEKADHYILNYQLITNNRTFRIETYYKKYIDLIKYSNGDPADVTNTGSGFVKGIELFWRDNRSIRNVDYWISYSFLDTKRDYLNTPHAVTPSFASAHNFSIVYKHFISAIKTQIGATYSYTSGRPYNNPNMAEFNAARTRSYQDLSANLSYLPTSQIIIHFSCTNVLGRDNIFGYEFASVPDGNGIYASRAIKQPAPRFLFLGVFITLSKDKGINQLPTL